MIRAKIERVISINIFRWLCGDRVWQDPILAGVKYLHESFSLLRVSRYIFRSTLRPLITCKLDKRPIWVVKAAWNCTWTIDTLFLEFLSMLIRRIVNLIWEKLALWSVIVVGRRTSSDSVAIQSNQARDQKSDQGYYLIKFWTLKRTPIA